MCFHVLCTISWYGAGKQVSMLIIVVSCWIYSVIIVTIGSTAFWLRVDIEPVWSLLHRLELLRGEESSVVAGEVVEGLVDLAFTVWQDHYLEEQSFSHAIQAAKSSLLQIIEVYFYSVTIMYAMAIGKVKVDCTKCITSHVHVHWCMYMHVHAVHQSAVGVSTERWGRERPRQWPQLARGWWYACILV